MYRYDANGKLIETLENNGELKRVYAYDSKGNEISYIRYEGATAIANNTPNEKYEYTYDTNGKQISSTGYNNAEAVASNTPTYTIIYEYDEYGNKLKEYRNGILNTSYIHDPAFLYNQWLANRKLRFTIQEADALTTNDNNNWVEWTFE